MDDAQLFVMDDHKAEVLNLVADNQPLFRDDFPEWLDKNWHIWLRFELEAVSVSRRRDHYAVATIWEVIRHNTMLQEDGSDFKLNNNFKADVARLFVLLHPSLNDFFEMRTRYAVNRRQAKAA